MRRLFVLGRCRSNLPPPENRLLGFGSVVARFARSDSTVAYSGSYPQAKPVAGLMFLYVHYVLMFPLWISRFSIVKSIT